MPTAITSRRSIALVAVVLVLAYLLNWQTTTAQADVDDAGQMVMVFDSSGSMKEKASGGQTKIEAAKTALGHVIGSLPDGQAVGLRVYGAKVFSANDKGACTDSQLVVPVETGNRDDLKSAVSKYKPYGETPIGYALLEADKDLGNEGKRTIVLVSDGEPTCAPDPCKAARELSKKGVDLRIDVVGLDVDGSAREKLTCIAAAGNGQYYDADSADDLSNSLVKLATRAARPFTASGQAVVGTPTADGAPHIAAGDWLDEIGEPDNRESLRNYVIARKTAGSTIHASATVQTVSGATETIDVDISTPGGDRCGIGTGLNQLGGGQLLSGGANADIVSVFGDIETGLPCMKAEELSLNVRNTVTTPIDTARPLEIRVIEEPPVQNAEELPKVTNDTQWTEPSGGKATKVIGGSSFNDAPLLGQGTYSDSLVPGEVLTYQVDLEWGQKLAALVTFPDANDKLGSALGRAEILSKVQIFGADRRDVSASAYTGETLNNQAFMQPEKLSIAVATAPVTYRNRGGGDPSAGTGLAGRYTVSVFLEEDAEDGSYVVPFTLGLGVDGDVNSGPDYAKAANKEANPKTRSSAESSEGGGPGVGFYAGGFGLLVLLGAGYVVLRRRSQRA